MRGKAVEMKLAGTVHGITPACAGKSDPCNRSGAHRRDHPRMCGEKNQNLEWADSVLGSPPRVQGKATVFPQQPKAGGITPAHAGKNPKIMCYYYAAGDHPRVCGEKCSCIAFVRQLPGSPPRMRGKGIPCSRGKAADRITPACAGKRAARMLRKWTRRGHPRVCGEKKSASALEPPE